jgi:hypothetical protein
MRLKTIWTIPGMKTAERLHRTLEWSAQVAASRLPLRVRYWATIQEIGKATRDSENVPATRLDEILYNLDYPK